MIAYGKIGRAFTFDEAKFGVSGGDNEPVALLYSLHEALPDETFLMMSRCTDKMTPLWVINPWAGYEIPSYGRIALRKKGLSMEAIAMAQQDASDAMYRDVLQPYVNNISDIIIWTGQHCTTCNRIPMTDGSGLLTSPLDFVTTYGGPLVQLLNEWRNMQDEMHDAREPIWLCPDVRNYLKARDIKHPLLEPVLGQFAYGRNTKHYQFDPPADTVIEHETRYKYSGLELCGVDVPEKPPVPTSERDIEFGIIVNETRTGGPLGRVLTVRDWVLPFLDADENSYIHGAWTDGSLKVLQRDIKPIKYAKMMGLLDRTRFTITLPGSGVGWATAKPWEMFAHGPICFFHPEYDTQGHILKGNEFLEDWLCVSSPEQMSRRIFAIMADPALEEMLRVTQWEHFVTAKKENRIVKEILIRLSANVSVNV